jgi:type I restriction enzyme S subunit
MNPQKSTGKSFLDQCQLRKDGLGPKRCQASLQRYEFAVPDIPDDWCWSSLSTLCERVSVGHVGPTSQYFSGDEDAVPLVRSQDVRPGLLHLENTARITPTFHRKLHKSTLKTGDVLFVRVGANRSDCCVVPQGIGEINCANIVFARPLYPNGFLGFYFRSPFARELLLSVTTGAAQGVINTQSVASLSYRKWLY